MSSWKLLPKEVYKDSRDLEQKRKLQQLVFPSGMGYNKQIDEVQTKRVNSIFSSIPLIATDLAQQKSGEPVKINQFSARVTSSGFKPETSWAVIKCSIQLSYEAIFRYLF